MWWKLLKKTLGSSRDPWTRPNWAPTRYTDHRSKNSDAAPGQILDVNFFGRFLSTPNEFGPKTSAIGSFLELYLQPYKVRSNLSPYAIVTSILVRAVPEIQNRLELEFDWASNLGCTPLLASYGGGQGGGHPKTFLTCSPSTWGVLQLGPGSQL